MQIEITYQNQTKKFPKETTYYEIAKAFGKKDTIAVKIDNVVESLDTKAIENTQIDFLNVTSLTGYKIYQAALKFMFFVAVKETFPESEVHFLHYQNLNYLQN